MISSIATERKPYPRTVKPRGKPRTQETPCPDCLALMWLKADYGDRRRMFCPGCHTYFTVYPAPANGAGVIRSARDAYTNEGNARWQALGTRGADDLEWTGSIAELLAEIEKIERAEHDAAWRVWCETRNA